MSYQVVVQVDTFHENLWKSLSARLDAMRAELGECTIEMVLHGSAVKALVQLVEPIDHVSIVVCQRALVGNGIDLSSLPSFVDVVPSGLAYLVKKQTEGWTYLKL